MNLDLNWLTEQVFFGYSVRTLLQIPFIFLITLILVYIVRNILLKRIKQFSDKSRNEIDDFIVDSLETVGWPVYVIIGLNLALQPFKLPEVYQRMLQGATVLVLTVYAVLVVQKIMNFFLNKNLSKNGAQVSGFFINLADIILWLLAALVILQNLGYDITALITGLGIGGVAIAFALQNILSDIFASISIYFDKPFKPGEVIQVGLDIGEVQKVGLKSTRIKTLQGEELVVSNKELTTARIHNFKRLQERRVVLNFGVDYNTNAKQLRSIPKIIQKNIEKSENTRFDRAHFVKFGDFSLLFEAVYYITSDDYILYMDTQQEVNLGIRQDFEKEEIKFAYPTETIYLKNDKK
ncbi:MAG: hypothetical protein OHK0017_00560 [Patescibacteria group bacterium]